MPASLPLKILALALAGALLVPASVARAVDGGGSSSAAVSAPSYASAKADVDAGRYRAAATKLIALVNAEPRNADAWNLLAYSSRKLNRNKDAARYYTQALKLDPNHRGALEYQGELFIALGRVDLAKANLAKLAAICGTCAELDDLKQALAEAGA